MNRETTPTRTAADDVEGDERIQPIHVSTDYVGKYQSVNHIRDLPPLHLDEPLGLGGKNKGPTALEATLAALNSCSAMIMYVLKQEMNFDLQDVEFDAEGWIDVRRIEMKRSDLLYSEVEPIAEHFDRVRQEVRITTSEYGDRFEHFKSEVHRLCPMHALLRDAGVDLESDWIQDNPLTDS